MAVTTQIRQSISITETGTADLGTPTMVHTSGVISTDHASGTSNNQNDLVWSDQRTLASEATEDIDLSALTNVFGGAVAFAEIAEIVVYADSGNTNPVLIGNASVEGFVGPFDLDTSTLAVYPGKMVVLSAPAAGWAVTNNTDDKLGITNGGSGSSVTYKIFITGRSA